MKILLIALFLVVSCSKNDSNSTPTPSPVPTVSMVQIGTPGVVDSSYSWSPMDGLDNPILAQPMASPKKTTLYTVTVTNKCGSVSASTYVHVFKKDANGKLIEVLN